MNWTELLTVLGGIAALAISLCVLIGYGVKLVLLPWLREHLVAPLLERLDTLAYRLEDMSSDMRVASRMYEGHIELSGEDRANLWSAIRELRELLPRRYRRRHPNRKDAPP